MIFTIKKADIDLLSYQSNSEFEDLYFNWHKAVSESFNNSELKLLEFLKDKLNSAQNFFYLAYHIDAQVRNGGFLQILLNRNMFFTYQILQTSLSDEENLKYFLTLVFNANKRISEIGLEVSKNGYYYDKPELAYKKYEHLFNPLDELYLKNLPSIWDGFKHTFIKHGDQLIREI